MALAAIIAVVHDIIITVGVYAVTGFEVTPGDGRRVPHHPRLLALRHRRRVRQGEGEHAHASAPSAATRTRRWSNRSLNQVLMRSINTSFVALLPVASLLVVGSGSSARSTLRDFALALFVGLLVGAYSSIFVATPIARLAQGARAALPRPLARAVARRPRAPARSPAAAPSRPRLGDVDEVAPPSRPTGRAPTSDAPPPADAAGPRRRARAARRRRRPRRGPAHAARATPAAAVASAVARPASDREPASRRP